jgi:hypothetical protein
VPTDTHEAVQRHVRENQGSADFPDSSRAQRVCRPNLQPTSITIALRLAANKRCSLAIADQDLACGDTRRGVIAGAVHRIGSCTVTSFVPSGNVASTWTSWIISATPSIT